MGCTLACRLAQDIAAASSSAGGGTTSSSRRRRRPSVGLIEARPPPPLEAALARDSPDPRVYSLAPSSVKVLREVGVWDGVRRRRRGGGAGGGEEEEEAVAGVLEERSQAFGGMQVGRDVRAFVFYV